MSMNFFAANKKILAICGRHNIHVYPMASTMPPSTMQTLDLAKNAPESSKVIADKLSAVCCDISHDGRYVVAADSGKNVFLFEHNLTSWDLFSSWEMEKRLVKVQFDKRATFVIMTDKTGDIFYSYMSLKSITAPKKSIGHTSYILDVILTEDNQRIITCDRDEKIRISLFPASHEILGYKLGHKEAIVNIALVDQDKDLISCSAEGTLKMWHMAENKVLKSWNIFQVMSITRPAESEVLRMKATDTLGRVYVSLVIGGFKELPVFEINVVDKTIRQFGQVRMESEFTDVCWSGEDMFVFNPEFASLRKFFISPNGLVFDDNFKIPALNAATVDWEAYASYNKPFYRLRKSVPAEVYDTVADAKNKIIAQFGELTEEEEPGTSTSKKTKSPKKKHAPRGHGRGRKHH